MIHFPKSQPAPASLAVEKTKKSGNYNLPDVLEALYNDFHNKCYLCEQKAPKSINIEHFVPHRGNLDLKFDWKNLFWSCEHCNKSKEIFESKKDSSQRFLDCTDAKQDVLNWIKYEIKPFPKEKVKLETLCQKTDYQVFTKNTVELLLSIYNGTTPQKTVESENLRKELIKEISNFQDYLMEYCEECLAEEKPQLLKKIKRHLSKQSAFTAFKRWIILDNEYLKKEFEKYFD